MLEVEDKVILILDINIINLLLLGQFIFSHLKKKKKNILSFPDN